jgi:hypothetical protein
MAYATKYTLTFMDVAGDEWVVNFQEDGFGGSSTALTPGPNPLVTTWEQSDKYQPIIGSTVDIQMVYETTIDSLYTEDNRGIRVFITKDASAYWYGFLAPGQYFRQFNQPKHYVTLTASDGLGELKGIKFEDGSGDPYFYPETEIVVIGNILQKTGLNLSIYEAVNIFEDDFDTTASDSPLEQTYFYQEKYWDEVTDERGNCYDVLYDILKKYGATIRQNTVYWRIYRPNDFSVSDDIYYRVYTYAGVYSSNDTHSAETVIGPTNYYLHADQEISKVPGVGSVEITASPGIRGNALKNGTFDDTFTWTGGAPYYWTNSGASIGTGTDSSIALFNNESASVPTQYIYTRFYLYKPESITINIDYRAAYTGTPTHAAIFVVLKAGTAYYNYASETWTSTAPLADGYYTYDLIADSKASMALGTFETLSIPIKPRYEATTGGFDPITEYELRLYEFHNETVGVGDYWEVKNIRVDVDYTKSVPETYLYTYDGPNSLSKILADSLNLCDSFLDEIITIGYDDMWFGVTSDAAVRGNLTTDWYIKGDNATTNTTVPIAQLLAKQYAEGYAHSLDLLRGTIRSNYTHVPHLALEDSNFVDDYGFTKRYYPRGLSYDARYNEYSGEWIECPATYTDEEMEWDSHDCGGDATITGNVLEIDSWINSGSGSFAYFDDYTAVAGETIRLVVELTNDGSSTAPIIYLAGYGIALSFGTNNISYTFTTAGAKTIELGYSTSPRTFNFTCTVDLYSITGV